MFQPLGVSIIWQCHANDVVSSDSVLTIVTRLCVHAWRVCAGIDTVHDLVCVASWVSSRLGATTGVGAVARAFILIKKKNSHRSTAALPRDAVQCHQLQSTTDKLIDYLVAVVPINRNFSNAFFVKFSSCRFYVDYCVHVSRSSLMGWPWPEYCTPYTNHIAPQFKGQRIIATHAHR